MRQLIFIGVIIFLLPVFGNSQVDSLSTSYKERYIYCEMGAIQKPFSQKFNIAVDYGDDPKKMQVVKDEETEKIKKFFSPLDALNYMAEQGWRFVDLSVFTSAGIQVNKYLLEKRVE
jgi:hypothetical protein